MNNRNDKNTVILNNTLLYENCIKGEIKKEIQSLQEFNENKTTTQKNLWDIMKRNRLADVNC